MWATSPLATELEGLGRNRSWMSTDIGDTGSTSRTFMPIRSSTRRRSRGDRYGSCGSAEAPHDQQGGPRQDRRRTEGEMGGAEEATGATRNTGEAQETEVLGCRFEGDKGSHEEAVGGLPQSQECCGVARRPETRGEPTRREVRERAHRKGGRKLDFPACDVPGHTAFEAAKANRNGPSMRVGPIRRRSGCCARVRAP